jgi:alanyl aminopeptidase
MTWLAALHFILSDPLLDFATLNYMRCLGLFLLVCDITFSQSPHFRLPQEVQPERYRLELTLVPGVEEFQGTVSIDLRVVREAHSIWLNANDLTVDSARLTVGGKDMGLAAISGNSDFLGWRTAQPLEPGTATLEIRYRGKQNSKGSDGIFRNEVDGEWYSFTQFEAIAARRAIPCFDEPGYKTPWQVTLRVKKDHLALANTPAGGEAAGADGMKTVRFAETKPLPAYLVAFAVGPFDMVSAGTAGRKKTPIQIVTPKGRGGEAKYAAESTGKILTLLEEYFGMPYPYEKLDKVALPLVGFAMENPGLITYGEGMILAKPEQDTLNRQREYVSVAAHEMAHQWFGDLVTTQWWNDIWLNEAFASWMGAKIEARFNPAWKTEVSELNSMFYAMGEDNLISARRIRQPVESKDDIANAFDGITYQKGEAVIRMFEQWVGEEKFRDGVRMYLRQHAFGNATAEDFLSSISAAAKVDVNRPFGTFLDQSGVPLLNLALSCQNESAPELQITQKRLLPIGSAGSAKQVWEVPVCVAYDTGNGRTSECTLVTGESYKWKLSKAKSCPLWVLGNQGSNGYYRTRYDGELLQAVLANHGAALTEREKVGVIDDVASLTKSGELPVGEALGLVGDYSNDASRVVTENVLEIARSIRPLLTDELETHYGRFVEKSFGARARALGWIPKAGEPEDDLLLRQRLVPFGASYGSDGRLGTEARSMAVKWLDDPKSLPPSMAGAVLATAARGGDRSLFEQFTKTLASTNDHLVRRRLLDAIQSFRDPALVAAAQQLFLSKDLDPREAFSLLFAGRRERRTRAMPFQFVRDHWDAIREKLPRMIDTDMTAELPFVTTAMCSEGERREVEEFFKDRMANATGGPRNLAQATEVIQLCAATTKAQFAGVVEFLRRF